MIPELRKRHRLLWSFWILLLPLGFAYIVWSLPQKTIVSELPVQKTPALADTEQTKETEWIKVNLLTQADMASKQLELQLKKPLHIPSAQLYWQGVFLGSIQGQDVYRFALDSALLARPPYTLEIRDPINQSVFQQISLAK
ncbi:MAG TPA: hypothetical protein PKA00_08640 [Saprospiraceae bacterium]|nr:hypothetical protein [Saprospiraceae bacterium]HMQ82962.1 hypothetical protein [Saprospiraceae bacterium]